MDVTKVTVDQRKPEEFAPKPGWLRADTQRAVEQIRRWIDARDERAIGFALRIPQEKTER